VLADLLTLTMIRSFREQPFILYGIAALAAMLLALFPLAAFVSAAVDPARSSNVGVLASVTVCLVGLGSFLAMTGLIAESVLLAQHEDDPRDHVIVREIA
jgi:hypothetical protein